MYKITVTIKKPGGMDVKWLRFSKVKLTMSECEKLLFKPKETGKSFSDKVKLEDFRCVRVKKQERMANGTINPCIDPEITHAL
ncbi:MAG: DUF1187 family protein [Symbiopectobacterium sp.]|uniref:DUF1187 family protein n=1 Tax=Symbiopectobacterium sp. TaxID=2952789 RepID=UPI003F35F0F4